MPVIGFGVTRPCLFSSLREPHLGSGTGTAHGGRPGSPGRLVSPPPVLWQSMRAGGPAGNGQSEQALKQRPLSCGGDCHLSFRDPWLQLSTRTGTLDRTASSALPVILVERWGSPSRFLSGPRLFPPAFLQMRHLTAPGHLVILTPLLTATT